MIKNPATSFLKISTCWVLILEEIPVYKKGKFLSNSSFRLIDLSVVSFYNFQWTRQYLDFFFLEALKVWVTISQCSMQYRGCCKISVFHRGGWVWGDRATIQVTGHRWHKQDHLVTYIKMSVTDSCNQLHFNTDLVTKPWFRQH